MKRKLLVVTAAVVVLLASVCSTAVVPSASSAPPPGPGQGSEWSRHAVERLAACLVERGWDVQVVSEGGWAVESGVLVEQRDLFDADRSDCLEALGLDSIEMTPEMATINFENTVRVVECLNDAGYETPEGPSRQSYINQMFENPQSEPWAPYEYVSVDDLQAAILSCPQ